MCSKGTERVIHLMLLAVRKKFRRCKIGRYIMSQLMNVGIVGTYDATVVHADNEAIPFFERCGFTSDIVLNSRWSELADQFTNCTLMCYLPPFTTKACGGTSDPVTELCTLDKEIAKWFVYIITCLSY